MFARHVSLGLRISGVHQEHRKGIRHYLRKSLILRGGFRQPWTSQDHMVLVRKVICPVSALIRHLAYTLALNAPQCVQSRMRFFASHDNGQPELGGDRTTR